MNSNRYLITLGLSILILSTLAHGQLPNLPVHNPIPDVVHGAQHAGDQAAKAAQDAAAAALNAAHTSVATVGNAAHQAVGGLGAQADQAIKGAGKNAVATSEALKKATSNVIQSGHKAISDTGNNLSKIQQETSRDIQSSVADTIDAGKALQHYCQNQINSRRVIFNDATRRLQEGKLVDAIWCQTVDSYRADDDNAFQATQDSIIINYAAEAAATAYGGPDGTAAYEAWHTYKKTHNMQDAVIAGLLAYGGPQDAAAYSAWRTYKSTGNTELAIKAGVITGASEWAAKNSGKIPAGGIPAPVRKAIVAGAIGGATVAAAGGNQAAVRDAFLRNGGEVLIQEVYSSAARSQTARNTSQKLSFLIGKYDMINPKVFPKDAFLRDKDGNKILDKNGLPEIDVTKLDPRICHASEVIQDEGDTISYSRSKRDDAAKISGINGLALYDDKLSVTWRTPPASKSAKPLAIVVTYFGEGSSLLSHLRSTKSDNQHK